MRSHLPGALALLLGAACSNTNSTRGVSDAAATSADSPTPPSGSADSSSTAAEGSAADGSPPPADAGAETACSAPMTSMVPAQWVRPSDCGGIGNLCEEGCGGASLCQLIGDYCQPNGVPPGECAPYCLAFACMTFDQASCFCTGDAGTQFGQCACGPEAVLNLCATEGASCDTTPCCSCQGKSDASSAGPLQCAADSVLNTKVCRQSCTKDSDCATNCCDKAAHICHDALYCNCVDAGSGCSGAGPNCCPGTTCLTFQVDAASPTYSCYANCDPQQTSCDGGCCSQAIPGKSYGACGPCQ